MEPILKLVRRPILSDDVYEQLKTLIMNGSIEPGARMNTLDLSRQLDVSPTPVREALARLESDGLVVKLPLKGYSTTDLLSGDQIRELYELRLLLEVPSARQAALHLTDAQAKMLEDEMAGVDEAPQDNRYETYQTLTAHDVRLHRLILTIAGNEMVRQAFERTHCHLHVFRLTYRGRFGEDTITEHTDVVNALLSRDGDAAEHAMRTHLIQSRDRVLANLAIPTNDINTHLPRKGAL